MSVEIAVTIRCDFGIGCDTFTIRGTSQSVNRREARLRAHERGWCIAFGGRDKCPGCRMVGNNTPIDSAEKLEDALEDAGKEPA